MSFLNAGVVPWVEGHEGTPDVQRVKPRVSTVGGWRLMRRGLLFAPDPQPK